MSLPSTRRWLANSLRDKVVGEGAEDKARAIWLAQGSRWFTEADAIWRVHDDASMFVGGIRALLLQSLHPLAMAGVGRLRDASPGRWEPAAKHGDNRWRRLLTRP